MAYPIGVFRTCAFVSTLALAGMAEAQGSGRPAELPPPSYAGEQYVDSKGCVFLRAGTEGRPLWVPRVTAGGKQICGYPPSGRRVPVVGEPGAKQGPFDPAGARAAAAEGQPGEAEATVRAPSAAAPMATKPKAGTKTAPMAMAPEAVPSDPAMTGGLNGIVVAIGSFGVDSNAKRATAAATSLGYSVLLDRVRKGGQTLVSVMAGPFDSMGAAQEALGRLHAAGFPDAIILRR